MMFTNLAFELNSVRSKHLVFSKKFAGPTKFSSCLFNRRSIYTKEEYEIRVLMFYLLFFLSNKKEKNSENVI